MKWFLSFVSDLAKNAFKILLFELNPKKSLEKANYSNLS